MKLESISVFLPALNEQDNIKHSLKSIGLYLSKKFKDYEIIVVANGSSDNTSEIVKQFMKKDKHVKLINENKMGYGVALKSGFANSTKELIFYTDGDNQFNIADMDKLLPMLAKYDIVSGYRINRRDPPGRILVANVYNLIINLLFHPNIRDIDASFKLFKSEVFKKIDLRANTGLIDAEVLIKAKKQGYLIGQVGVRHYAREAGQTIYATANKNDMFVFVKPKVVIDILREIKVLWHELR